MPVGIVPMGIAPAGRRVEVKGRLGNVPCRPGREVSSRGWQPVQENIDLLYLSVRETKRQRVWGLWRPEGCHQRLAGRIGSSGGGRGFGKGGFLG